MLLWKRAALLGFLSWLIPFMLSFLVFPIRKLNAPLFETLMSLILLLTAGALLQLYFQGRVVWVSEAVLVGLLWVGINLVLDYPMFAFGPMRMAIGSYYSEIGFSYLIFPVFALAAARLAEPTHRAGVARKA